MAIFSTARDTLKNMTCSINGKGYSGNVDEINIPEVSSVTEENRYGGTNASIVQPVGVELSEFMISVGCYNQESFDLVNTYAIFTATGSIVNQLGLPQGTEVTAYGLVTNVTPDSWTPGKVTKVKITMKSPDFFKQSFNDSVRTLIDKKNMIQIIGGIDQLAAERAVLGL